MVTICWKTWKTSDLFIQNLQIIASNRQNWPKFYRHVINLKCQKRPCKFLWRLDKNKSKTMFIALKLQINASQKFGSKKVCLHANSILSTQVYIFIYRVQGRSARHIQSKNVLKVVKSKEMPSLYLMKMNKFLNLSKFLNNSLTNNYMINLLISFIK